jgi:GNAT superfamily N-acetyltransferase
VTSTSFAVLPADVDDATAASLLAARLVGGSAASWRVKFAQDVTEHDKLLVVARVGGQLVGYGRAEYWAREQDALPRIAPTGWYLSGLLVEPIHRGHGIGAALIATRLGWLAERTDRVWYFTNARNSVSLRLHDAAGFREVTRDFEFPGVSFEGGSGILASLAIDDRPV